MKKYLLSLVTLFVLNHIDCQISYPSVSIAQFENNIDGENRILIKNSDSGQSSYSGFAIFSDNTYHYLSLGVFSQNFNQFSSGGLDLKRSVFFRTGPETNNFIFSVGNPNGSLIFTNGETERLRLSGNGNLGIGTSSPQSKLSVKGNIESQEIQVKVTVADYVFNDNYELLSLEEIEDFIDKNKYLPGMYNQKDADNNRGLVPLGEVSMKLLEKIEELTLYTILLNKRIKQLESEIGNSK